MTASIDTGDSPTPAMTREKLSRWTGGALTTDEIEHLAHVIAAARDEFD